MDVKKKQVSSASASRRYGGRISRKSGQGFFTEPPFISNQRLLLKKDTRHGTETAAKHLRGAREQTENTTSNSPSDAALLVSAKLKKAGASAIVRNVRL
jgi:hypothetical protein